MARLTDLPADALLCLLNHVVAASNTGQLLKLAAAGRHFLDAVAHADWFWQQQSAGLGWIRTGLEHPPHAQPPAASTASAVGCCTSTTTSTTTTTSSSSSRLWFTYYCLRMSCRWRLRLLLRKYIPFLNIQSRLAMHPGASIQELEAAEAALGMKLPWELWELYRYRAGQAAGAGVCFAEACRYLGVHELSVTGLCLSSRPSLAPDAAITQQQQLAAVQAQLPALSCRSPAHHNSSSSSMDSCSGLSPNVASEGCSHDTPGVVFLSNTMGSLQYVVGPDSAVYLKRGFTHRRVAGNVTAFIQHLLA